MSAATRCRIRERYWTVQEISNESGLTQAGVRSRIRAGVTGEALLQRIPDRATTRAERAIRRKLKAMARAKYKRACPNCGHWFDMFQPSYMLKHIKPG
ncbi:MAG: hypothetical protein ACLQJL_06365 [Roseiarcus sp.]